MALLSKLRNLITLSRSVPEYAPTDAQAVPILGPDGEDWSIDQESPDGPLKQIGTRRVSSPLQARIKSGLPDIISSGLAAAAHQNTAGGGPADFFGALQDAEVSGQRKKQLGLQNQRQANQDSIANRREQIAEQDYSRRVASDEQTASHQRDMDKRLATQSEATIANQQQGSVNDAIAKGARLISPQMVGGLSPEQRGMVRKVGDSFLLYPTETEQFQKGRVKVTVPEDMQKQFGLPAEHYVKPEELDSWITAIRTKTPNLHFESHSDETTGDVTTVARDPTTGEEKFRTTEKGIAKKRPPQDQTHGSYQPIYDEFGNIKSFFNPLTNDNKPAPEGARKPLSDAALTARATLMNSIEDARKLGTLGEKYQKHIGFVKGKLTDAERKVLGVDEGINDMFRIADDLADKLLRARSGAAITEGEYERLRRLMPDPRGPYSNFKSNLRLFLSDSERMFKGKTGKDMSGPPAALAAPSGGLPAVGSEFNGQKVVSVRKVN